MGMLDESTIARRAPFADHYRGRPKTPAAAPARYWILKRALDIVVAGTLLLVLAPLMLTIAVLIKAQDPRTAILFHQPRTGLGGRRFRLLKFRTMVADADALKEQLREQSLVPWPDFRLVNDPRVTRLGRVLRTTSLDELPQFINVLVGDMTLVGPRPTSFAAETYDLWHTGRLEFRPGVTGPWQLWGRTTMDFEERCRLEISFFRRPSLLRELKVLLLTPIAVLRRTGAA
jgi:lipopolysaccharide/colanic/teichoic acid biosynthesis glycosyltransferase